MFDCVIVMAGSGKRASLGYNKAFLQLNNQPLFMYAVKKFASTPECAKIILVCNIDEAGEVKKYIKGFDFKIEIVVGGLRRQDSALEGVKATTSDIVLVHDAARPNVSINDISAVYKKVLDGSIVATLASKVKNTIKEIDTSVKTLNRDNLYSISTPQGFRREEYIRCANDCANLDLIDDCQPFEICMKVAPSIVLETSDNFKVTTKEDIEYAKYLLGEQKEVDIKTGLGYDIHRLEKNRKLILAGVNIPYEYGLLGHSDGDVVYHAIMNAILGALGKGDIGEHFPDTDIAYKDIDSKILFEKVVALLNESGYQLGNLDVSIICQKPKLLKYKEAMKQNVASILNVSPDLVNIKANTNEGMDAIGKGLAIASLANVLIKK